MERGKAENLALVCMGGCEEFGSKIEYYIRRWHDTEQEFILKAECPRFATGEGKCMLFQSIRGRDIFIIVTF